jgi:hypothetical protein
MNKRPGHVTVTTEVGYCSFCGRPRNVRSEAHHLGTLVRTIVTCETCHRTLSSTVGVASEEAAPAEEPVKVEAPPEPEAKPKRAPARRATTKAPAARKTAARTPAKRATTKKK